MPEHSPLIITRFMNPYAQAALAHRVSKLAGLELAEPGLELLSHGEAGVELITEQHYEKALNRKGGALGELNDTETQDLIRYHLNDTGRAPTESKVLIGETEPAKTRTRNGKALIYYPVRIAELAAENERTEGILDELNGMHNMVWGGFRPHLVVAAVPRQLKRFMALTKAFEVARPERAVLMGAKVVQSQS